MSAGIPLPALSVRAPDPMEGLQRVMTLRSLMQQQAMQPGQLQLQQQQIAAGQQEAALRQQQIKDQQAMTQAYQKWDGKDPADLGKLVTDNGGSGNARTTIEQHYLGLKKTYSEIAKSDVETGQKKLDFFKQKNDMALGAINAAEDVPDEQLAGHLASTLQDLQGKGLLDDQHGKAGMQLVQALQSGQIDAKLARTQLDMYKKDLQSNSQQIEQAAKEAETAFKTAQTKKINAEINPNNPADPNIRKQKYEGILQKLQQEGPGGVTPNEMNFARSFEFGQRKTTTQSDSLGVTSVNTNAPSGIDAAIQAFRKGGGVAATPTAPSGAGGRSPAPSSAAPRPSGSASVTAPSAKDSLVDMIGQYKYAPAGLTRLVAKHPEIIAQVGQKYPDWSQSNYNAINKAVTDLAPSGKTGQQITSYNTFLRHAGALYDAVDKLDNSKYSDLLNKPMNWLAQHTGDPRVADFMAAMQPPMKEFQSFLLNNHAMHEEDVKDAHSLIDVNKTPQEIRAVLKRFAETGSARLSEQNESFKRVTGRDIPNLVSPEAAKAYNKITGQGGGTPKTHIFSLSTWQKANPQGDPKAAEAAARAQGFTVVP